MKIIKYSINLWWIKTNKEIEKILHKFWTDATKEIEYKTVLADINNLSINTAFSLSYSNINFDNLWKFEILKYKDIIVMRKNTLKDINYFKIIENPDHIFIIRMCGVPI